MQQRQVHSWDVPSNERNYSGTEGGGRRGPDDDDNGNHRSDEEGNEEEEEAELRIVDGRGEAGSNWRIGGIGRGRGRLWHSNWENVGRSGRRSGNCDWHAIDATSEDVCCAQTQQQVYTFERMLFKGSYGIFFSRYSKRRFR